MANRKGVVESMGEMAFAMMLFVIVLVIFFLLTAIFGPAKVDVTLEAENAAFVCNNNIVVLMQTEYETGATHSDLAIAGYADNNYELFEEKIIDYFNAATISIGLHNWQIRVIDSEKVARSFGHTITGTQGEDYESCVYRIPLPCREDRECALDIQLRLEF